MRIFVTGGTGFVGGALVKHLADLGHEIMVLTRSERTSDPRQTLVRPIAGDPTREGPWQAAAAEADVVINLAGASIFERWTPETKKRIVDSRLMTTRNLVAAMAREPSPGKVLLSTSAVGYYGFHGDEDLNENSEPGRDFLADLTGQWETRALEAENHDIRVVLMRFGIVLATGGGALGQMLPLFRWGLGGPLGLGRQWFSWIHRTDLIRAAAFVMAQETARGPFNFTAPNPVRNRDLARTLGQLLHRPSFLPAPGFMIKLILGEFGSVLLEGQKVLPEKLLDLGFQFTFPTLPQALAEVLARG
jgi:hypothetical protein